MNHTQRLVIARRLGQLVRKKHGKTVLAIAIYGSVAKKQDRRYSDLELFVVTKKKKILAQRYIYQDIAIEISYIPEQKLLQDAVAVTTNWPIEADFFRSYHVLYEKNKWFSKLRRILEKCTSDSFNKAIERALVWLHELMGKIKNAYRYGDDELFYYLASLLGWESMMVLGLINRQYYRSERTVFKTVLSFDILPKRYQYLLGTVCHFKTTDRHLIYRAALELHRGLTRLAADQGVVLEQNHLVT